MLPNEEEKPKVTMPRRSSLKFRQQAKLDPDAIMKAKPTGKQKRNSVSWGKSNTFEFKAMKAMFTESEDINKQKTEEDKEKHKKFLETRKASIKNEFSILKDLMKKNPQTIIEEENDEEARQNMKKNLEIGKEALKEASESAESHSSKGSRSQSKSVSKSGSKSGSKSASKSVSKNSSKHSSRNQSSDKKLNKENEKENKEEKTEKSKEIKIEIEKSDKENEKEKENNEDEKVKLRSIKKVKLVDEPKEKEILMENDKQNGKDKENEEVKLKKKRVVKLAEKPKEEGNENSNEDLKEKENEAKTPEKIRFITIKEANNLDIDDIAYITLNDGTVAVLKKEGHKVIELMNPLNKKSNKEQNINQNISFKNKNRPNQQKGYQMKKNNYPQDEAYYQDNIYENPSIPQPIQNYIRNVPKSNYSLYDRKTPNDYINQENTYFNYSNNLYDSKSLLQNYDKNTEPTKLRHFNSNKMPQSRYSYQTQYQNQQKPQTQYLNKSQYQESPKFKRIIESPLNDQKNRNSLNLDYSQNPNSSSYKYKLIDSVPSKLYDNCNSIRHCPIIYQSPYCNQQLYSNTSTSRIDPCSYQRQPYSYSLKNLNNYNCNKFNSFEKGNNVLSRQRNYSFNDFNSLKEEPYDYKKNDIYRNYDMKYGGLSVERNGETLKNNNLSQSYLYPFGRQKDNNNINSYMSGDSSYTRNQNQRYNYLNYK